MPRGSYPIQTHAVYSHVTGVSRNSLSETCQHRSNWEKNSCCVVSNMPTHLKIKVKVKVLALDNSSFPVPNLNGNMNVPFLWMRLNKSVSLLFSVAWYSGKNSGYNFICVALNLLLFTGIICLQISHYSAYLLTTTDHKPCTPFTNLFVFQASCLAVPTWVFLNPDTATSLFRSKPTQSGLWFNLHNL